MSPKKGRQSSIRDHISLERPGPPHLETLGSSMAESAAGGAPPDTLASIAAGITAIREDFARRFDGIEKRFDDFLTRITTVETRMSTAEARLEAAEERLVTVEADRDALAARVAALEKSGVEATRALTEVDDQSRANNIRIVGVKEGLENGNPSTLAARILKEVFGLTELPIIDRAFRLPLPRSGPVRPGPPRPRVLLARMTSWAAKDALIREARRRRNELRFNGEQVLFFNDFSKATAIQRASFREPLKRLYELNYSSSLLYPAKLRVTTAEGPRFFTNAQDAMGFVDSLVAAGPSPSSRTATA